MIRKLRRKFILINMTLVTAMLLLVFGMVNHFTRMEMERQSLMTMERILEKGPVFAQRPGRSAEQVQLPFFYVSLNQAGEPLTIRGEYFDLSDRQTLDLIIGQAVQHSKPTGLLTEYNLRFLKKPSPFGLSIVFVDISSAQATLQGLVKTCILIGILSFSAFLGLSFWLARWAIGPVEKAWNQQRQFVADASHELKTPLTVIMTNADLLLQPEYGEGQKAQFSESILTMTRQMRGLVESLLELARVDNGSIRMEFAPVNLSELISDALLPFEPVLFERGLLLEADILPGIHTLGSASHIRQVADIFLDNAAKYASGGTVTLKLSCQGSRCLLSIASEGPAISKSDLKNIFTRFYRLDKARSMNHSYGLGLSIAETIVDQHGGKIWAESENGVNTFFVSLNLLPLTGLPAAP